MDRVKAERVKEMVPENEILFCNMKKCKMLAILSLLQNKQIHLNHHRPPSISPQSQSLSLTPTDVGRYQLSNELLLTLHNLFY